MHCSRVPLYLIGTVPLLSMYCLILFYHPIWQVSFTESCSWQMINVKTFSKEETTLMAGYHWLCCEKNSFRCNTHRYQKVPTVFMCNVMMESGKQYDEVRINTFSLMKRSCWLQQNEKVLLAQGIVTTIGNTYNMFHKICDALQRRLQNMQVDDGYTGS